VRRYATSDYPEVAGWYAAHGEPVPDAGMLPGFGLIVPGLACGFLYRTDASFALLEGFVTNPAAHLRARHLAIGEIVDALTEEAKAQGFRHVVGLSRSTGIASLVQRRQFRAIGRYDMLTREA
jgi:hypothetical protein